MTEPFHLKNVKKAWRWLLKPMEITWCLKITEKVALSIASEVRYVYIHFEGIKLKMPKFKCDILSNFPIMWNRVNFEEKQNFMTAKYKWWLGIWNSGLSSQSDYDKEEPPSTLQIRNNLVIYNPTTLVKSFKADRGAATSLAPPSLYTLVVVVCHERQFA